MGLLFVAAVPVAAQSTPNWNGGARLYRVDIEAGAGGFVRTDKVAEASMDLQALLAEAGGADKKCSTPKSP